MLVYTTEYVHLPEVPVKKGYWYIAAAAFLFSTAEIASKFVVKMDPFQLVLLRFFVGGLFLLPFALGEMKRRGLRLGWNDFLFFGFTSSFAQTGIPYSLSRCVAFFGSDYSFSRGSIFRVFRTKKAQDCFNTSFGYRMNQSNISKNQCKID